jgi:HEAT repeat protein
MKKPDPIEHSLERLSQLRNQTDAPSVASELRQALTNRSNLVVAKAAKVAGELRASAVLPDLLSAFNRLMKDPGKLDKRCAAVTEIVTALYELDYTEPGVYLCGIVHVQMEASFGPPVDEAAKLRAQCALGLGRTRHPDALLLVAELLADREPHARIGAIRALTANGGDGGLMLLRYKAVAGDTDPEVLSECFVGLLDSDFSRSLPFISRFIDSEDSSTSEAAILAIGSQRRAEAFRVLREKWDRSVSADIRKTLLTAIAMVRIDEATDFLFGLLESHSTSPTGLEVIRVLAAYHREQRIRDRLEGIVHKTGESALRDALRKYW